MRVTIIDFVERGPTRDPFKRRMSPSFANVMPQAIAVWCEELGHDVRYVCYTGYEDLSAAAGETDLLIVGAYTQSALAAYAVGNIYRHAGAVTVLGGPHARCYPEDAARHFDYVLGFTTKVEIAEILGEAAPHRPRGRCVAAQRQPRSIPTLRERWKFVEATLAKAGPLKIVPMLGSLGCPYTCSFCIDAAVPYQPLDFDELKADLRFVRSKFKSPLLGWHDPNFGVRFKDYLGAMEEAVPPGSVRSIAEMSLSLLSDENLDRLKKNGFVGMLPGIESWYDYGNKSKTSHVSGMDRVEQVADHINRVLERIPFVQANFILGLDCDSGREPFELTKRFIDLTPGAYHAFSLFTAYGRASPLNLELQRAGRVNAMPFHFLDSNHGMNIVPLHYDWADFYDLVADVTRHALGGRAIWRRFLAGTDVSGRLFNLARGLTTGRPKYQAGMARMLRTDPAMRAFLDGKTHAVPPFFEARLRADLGPLWDALPPGALDYDPNAYANGEMAAVA
jgi:hypothetical protein